jgi:hypothetical protein
MAYWRKCTVQDILNWLDPKVPKGQFNGFRIFISNNISPKKKLLDRMMNKPLDSRKKTKKSTLTPHK